MAQFFLLRNAEGFYRCVTDNVTGHSSLAGNEAMWVRDGDALRSAVSDVVITVADLAEDFIIPGPTRLPSEHLQELNLTGATVLENVLDDDAIKRIKAQADVHRTRGHADEDPWDGHFWMMSGMAWCPDMARAATHPVALWLIQEYMATENIHFCHQPIMTTLKPAKKLIGTHPRGGWHSDYPYHPGVFPDNYWPPGQVYGVQYNVCVDPFETGNAATQYVPGSHRLGYSPPVEFNEGGTHAGEGQHKNVQQLLAPAGAGLIYDARTWHRACHELNTSGEDRIALLNAVAPAWVVPMIDRAPVGEKYLRSDVPSVLTERERLDVERLCNQPPIETPEGQPQLRQRKA